MEDVFETQPMPDFKPTTRQSSTSARDRILELQSKTELDSIPLNELIKKKFGVKNFKNLNSADPNKQNDEDQDQGDITFEEHVGDDFINVYNFDVDEMEADGFDLVPDSMKSEFNEPTHRRFGTKEKKTSPRWTLEETELFYKVLSMCGMDFSMISKFFPSRTRKMVVNKFKCEQRKNSDKVNAALKSPMSLDIDLFAEVIGIKVDSILEDYKKNKDRLKSSLPPPKVKEIAKDDDAEEDLWENPDEEEKPEPIKEENENEVPAQEDDDEDKFSFE